MVGGMTPPDPTPAEVARRLSPAQKQILELLPRAYGNDAFATAGKCGVGHNGAWQVCRELRADGLVELDESEMPIFPNKSMGIGWANLTPLGLAVRAVLEQEARDANQA